MQTQTWAYGTDRVDSFRVRKEESVLADQKRRRMARDSSCVPDDYGVAEMERREFLKLVYVGSNPTSVASFEKFDAEYTGVVKPPGTDS